MKLPVRRPTFPLGPPTWPGAVGRPPVQRRTGLDFETDWARSYPARLGRAAVLDGAIRPLLKAVAAPAVHGLDRLAALSGPALFVANHASHLDTPLLLTSLPDRFRHRTVVVAASDYFFDKRWKGALWAFTINAIPVERQKISRRSADDAARLLADGWSVMIYPEGGRTPDGWAQPFKAGAAYLSLRVGAPVVPIHLEGTGRVFGKGAKRVRPGRTAVTFGGPLYPAEGEKAAAFAGRIEHAVSVLADEQATDWWSARRRASAGDTPTLSGPSVGAWRRSWALQRDARRSSTDTTPRWPTL